MKNSPLAAILLGVLTVSVLASLVICYFHVKASREIQMWQTQVGMVQNNRAVVGALMTDALKYSEKNPSINPILEFVGAKPNATAPARTGNQ